VSQAGEETGGSPGRTGAASPRPRPRSAASPLATRTAWLLLALVAIAALAIGSVHGSSSSATAREAQLDSVIKCPACQDLSIAQSDAPSSVALRRRVAQFVAEGWSNARIESWVTQRYGSNALLVPQGGGVGDTLYLVPVAAIGIAAAGLGWYLWRRRPMASSGSRVRRPAPAVEATGPAPDAGEAASLPRATEGHPLEAYLHRDRKPRGRPRAG
jgi:cytochrome c-type biogenesis protein CcmH/NrfF